MDSEDGDDGEVYFGAAALAAREGLRLGLDEAARGGGGGGGGCIVLAAVEVGLTLGPPAAVGG